MSGETTTDTKPRIYRHTSRKSGRAGLTQSKLRNPDALIYSIAQQFQNYMHLPDPTPLYVLLGTVAGNMLTGYPVWTMFVGSSGTGKSELLKSLGLIPHIKWASSIKGEAALLSGVKKKDQAHDATGGLLRDMQWGNHKSDAKGFGCLVFSDFTSILSMQRDNLKEVLSAFREVYDQRWTRNIGGEGGRELPWAGKIGMISGCTPAIDRHHEVMADMGQRSLYFRFPQTDGYQESISAAGNVDPEQSIIERQQLIAGMYEAVGLSFEHPTIRRTLDSSELDRLVGLAQFGARARSQVPRDQYTKEITDVPSPEAPPRVTVEMVQLYVGLEKLGLDAEDRWGILGRVMMDGMPLTRGVILKQVLTEREGGKKGHGWGTGEVAGIVKCGETSVRRELENLQVLGVIEQGSGKGNKGWEASEWTKDKLNQN